jgi:hypothetical protein
MSATRYSNFAWDTPMEMNAPARPTAFVVSEAAGTLFESGKD